MKIKYTTTIYNRSNPYGAEKTCISQGEPVEKPSYLCGCDNHIFLKNERGVIAAIDRDRIIKIY